MQSGAVNSKVNCLNHVRNHVNGNLLLNIYINFTWQAWSTADSIIYGNGNVSDTWINHQFAKITIIWKCQHGDRGKRTVQPRWDVFKDWDKIWKCPNILNHSDVCLAKLCDNFDNSIFRSVSFKCWAKMFHGFFSGHIGLLRWKSFLTIKYEDSSDLRVGQQRLKSARYTDIFEPFNS